MHDRHAGARPDRAALQEQPCGVCGEPIVGSTFNALAGDFRVSWCHVEVPVGKGHRAEPVTDQAPGAAAAGAALLLAVHDLDSIAAGQPAAQLPPAARPDPAPQACDHCDLPILWVWSSNGVRMPIDRDPTPDGNILIKGEHGGVLGKTQAAAARQLGEQLRRHHVLSCPHADRWSRGARDDARRAGGRR